MGTSNPRVQGRGLSFLDLRVVLCGPASLLDNNGGFRVDLKKNKTQVLLKSILLPLMTIFPSFQSSH